VIFELPTLIEWRKRSSEDVTVMSGQGIVHLLRLLVPIFDSWYSEMRTRCFEIYLDESLTGSVIFLFQHHLAISQRHPSKSKNQRIRTR
jgi:hypothetical protein